MDQFEIDPSEYMQKRYEIAKEIIASYYTGISTEKLIEAKQRDSVIFNCIQIADMLLTELGYTTESEEEEIEVPVKKGPAEKSVHKLSELLKKNGDEDE